MSERTFSQLAAELEHVYGCNAASVFVIYTKHNPLKFTNEQAEQYWEHTRRFLDHLHAVLYAKDHQLSLHVIKPESYFFLTKICIDHAFTVTELINIRNDREQKYSKNMANDIAHHILPPYLTYRRQTLNCSFGGASGWTGPGIVSQQAMATAMYMPMPMPMHYPYLPQTTPMPTPMPMPTPRVNPFPPPSIAEPVKRIRPYIRRKPTCIRKGEERTAMTEGLTMPLPTDTDEVPLNFYSVYCSDRANKVNNTAEEHHVPQIFPVPNRPPPP
jgi:hypothetical protein